MSPQSQKSDAAQNKLAERWDLTLRYRFIEIIALWEGRLTARHLQEAFGIGRGQASKTINQYLKDVAPDNLVLDSKIKGHVPTDAFTPRFTQGDINEYLSILNTRSDLMTQFASLGLEQANTEVIKPLGRAVKPQIVRPLIKAARENLRIEIEYASLTSEKDYRNIAPHTLVFNGYRWHVRAYCEKSGQFRDFVLSRISQIYDYVGPSEQSIQQDDAWNTQVTIALVPDSRLSPAQQQVIADDYGMENNLLEIQTRGAMVQYALQFLRVSTKAIDADPNAQQVVIKNLADVKPWLFS